MEYALRKQIQHLASYISDRSAIAAYVNNEHGLSLSTLDIIEVTANDRRRFYSTDHAPMMPSPLIVTHKWKGYDPLAVALFKYHAARSFGPDQKYWLERLNDKRAKPKTTVEL
jgi:hypothetical protein